MSGDFQHYIPQSFLKGFRTKLRGNPNSVWTFRRDEAPSLELIKEIAGETHFYSKPAEDGHDTLDDEITRYENRLAALTRGLRKQKPDTVADPEVAAEVIAHLSLRTDSVRSSLSYGAKQMALRAYTHFRQPETMRHMIGLDADSPTERFGEVIAKLVRENPELQRTGLPSGALERVAFGILKERFADAFEEHSPAIGAGVANMYFHAETLVRDGHNKVLTNSVVPAPRVEALRQLQWTVIQPSEPVILPDCVAIGIDANGDAAPLMMIDLDKADLVVMALSSNRLLVGKRDPEANFDSFLFNLQAAACSESFFVGASDTDELRKWSRYIGVRSRTVVNQGLAEALVEWDDPEKKVEKPTTAPDSDDTPQVPANWLITFLGCADEATAKRIAEAVSAVVSEVCDQISLNRLDGITYADDYPAALANLDRGFGATAPLKRSDEEGTFSISMAPMVLRDGVVKTHIVMRGGLGQGLLSEDESLRRLSVQALVGGLADAGCTELFDTALPGIMLKPIANPFDAQRYARIANAWTGYFAARVGAPYAPDAGEPLRELLIAALDRARIDIPEARLDYRFHGDVPLLLDRSLKRVQAILQHAARLIGHYDGISGSPMDKNGLLDAALAKLNLKPWFDSYGDDLRRLWDRRSQWGSFEEFLALSGHVERIMWQFGMVLWQMPDGQCRVEVPMATDLQRLPLATLKRPLWLAKAITKKIASRFRRSA